MKDKFKRLLGLVLALIMILGYMPTNLNTAHAAEGDVEINATNFPDNNFMIYVSRNIDKDNNGVLSKSECEEVKKVEINNLGISSIKGIEHFTNLEELRCIGNNLYYTNLRKNTKLIKLFMSDNKLTRDIDLSQNTHLTDLSLSNNNLNEIDLSQNKSLKILDIANNNLENLDLKNNTELTNVLCNDNEIRELDISENKKLITINCNRNELTSFDASNNSLLERLDLDDNTSLGEIKLATLNSLKTLNCASCNLTKLDISGCKALTELDCRHNKLDRLDTSNNTSLENLICSNNALTGLFTGLTTSIKYLDVSNNNLTDIRLDYLSNLETLNVSYNKLEDLDIKNKDNLTKLNCSNNNLKSLNIQHNGNNELDVDCSVNPMRKLSYAGKVNVSSYEPVYSIEIPRGTSEIPATKVEQMLDMQNVIGDFSAMTKNGSNYDWIEDWKITFKYKLSEQPELIANNAEIKIIKVKNEALDKAEELVTKAETKRTYQTHDTAKEAVDKLAKGSGKDALVRRLGYLKSDLDIKTVVVPDPTDPGQVPTGRVRVTFDAGDGNTIDGKYGTNRYKYIDVKTNTEWTNKEVQREIPEKAINQDTKQEFDKWSETVPTAGTVEAKTFTATYKAKELVKAGTDPNAAVPNGYTRVKFDAGEGNTIDGTNRYKVIDVLTGTAWDNKAVKDEIPEKAKYKDATKIFTEWDSTVPTTGPVEEQDFTAIYRTPAPTPDPTNPIVGPVDPQDPNGGKPADPSKYYVVTFVSADTTMGTVDAKNTAYVLKTETKTLADITAPKTTAVQGYEFEKWEPALDNATSINKDLEVKAYFKQKGTTPQNPPVVGPVDPQDPNGGKPADPSKYYVVTFVSENENKGTVAKANTVYVPMRAGKTFADLARFAPAAIPYYGYEFAGWSPYLYGNTTIIDRDMVIYARFEEIYTPSYPYPYERRRPRRKYNDRDDRYERDDNEEEKIEEAKVYDKLEAILFINNNLMQKSVNGVVSQVRMDIAPFIYQSRTMLPIRFVAESLGFMVTWDANTRTVYLVDKENIVQIPVDTNNIIVNGNTFVSDVKPMIKNNRTMLPVANIARALGLVDGKDILWDAATKQVTIIRMVEK